MKVQNQKRGINFTSIPIHNINLKKVTNGVEIGSIKAVFSKLDVNDPKDSEALFEIKELWDDKDKLVCCMYRHFKIKTPDNEYFTIELPGNNSLSDRIIGLANTFYSAKDKVYNLLNLITKPSMQYYTEERGIKGVGETLLGEIFQKARENNASNLVFGSLANNFYNKSFDNAKMTNYKIGDSSFRYTISRDNFDKYIKYCQEKYNDNFSTII